MREKQNRKRSPLPNWGEGRGEGIPPATQPSSAPRTIAGLTFSPIGEKGAPMITLVISIFVILVAFLFLYPQPCSNFHEAKIQTPKTTLSLALAETQEEQSKGLSGCTYLPKNSGMYFPFELKHSTFWMKNMVMPIDIVWIAKGIVVGIDSNVPFPSPNTDDAKLPAYHSPIAVDAVLEVGAGMAESYGLTKGARVFLAY